MWGVSPPGWSWQFEVMGPIYFSGPLSTTAVVRPYLKQYSCSDADFGVINAGSSRDTFEDALSTSRMILENDFKKVILVTSDYHMFRSWIILKLLLAGNGVEVQRFPVPRPTKNFPGLLFRKEVPKFWISLAELAYYKATGERLADLPRVQKLRKNVNFS
jgi:uncharacterized SAM-binding protein YcdF (DUF218 family)